MVESLDFAQLRKGNGTAPSTLDEALSSPDDEKWKIVLENNSLLKTWTFTE